MKILFVCFYTAYPPTSGAATVTYSIAKYISGESLLLQLGDTYGEEITSDNIRIFTLNGRSDNNYFKMLKLHKNISNIMAKIDEVSPDLVVLEGASWSFFHWMLLRKIRQNKPNAKIIYHSHNVEYLLRKEKHGNTVSWLAKWAEGNILRNVNLSFAVSDVDALHFEKLYGIRPKILPNGVDVDSFDQVTENEINISKAIYGIVKNTILFLGSYLYKPNHQAVDFLVKSVMPRVIQKYPHAKLAIIGGDVPYKKPWLINPGVIPYKNLPAFIKTCKVGVAPIFSGSGTRLKILEYMAGKLPVVSTHKGAEGLHVQRDWNILIADREPDFSTEVCKLLSNDQLCSTFGERSREVVNTHYSWKTIMNDWNEFVCNWYPKLGHYI